MDEIDKSGRRHVRDFSLRCTTVEWNWVKQKALTDNRSMAYIIRQLIIREMKNDQTRPT